MKRKEKEKKNYLRFFFCFSFCLLLNSIFFFLLYILLIIIIIIIVIGELIDLHIYFFFMCNIFTRSNDIRYAYCICEYDLLRKHGRRGIVTSTFYEAHRRL